MSVKVTSIGVTFSTPCDIKCIHVKISNYKTQLKNFANEVSDKSWVSKLKGLDKLSLSHNAEKTIEKIEKKLIAKKRTKLTADVGEYLVSYSAQDALAIEFSHEKIPLAELLKEKISGNPGFDFHTICLDKLLIFGEAKFSLKSTPRGRALKQISEFIDDKDIGELIWLKPFLKAKTISNVQSGLKGYAAAFSYNDTNLKETFSKAASSTFFKNIISHKKLFLIAVELC